MIRALQIVSEFKKKVSNEFGEVEVILFGSHARYEAEEESDVDILLILNRDVDIKVKELIYDIAYEIGLEYDTVLDVNVYSRGVWDRFRGILPLMINVEREGVTIVSAM